MESFFFDEINFQRKMISLVLKISNYRFGNEDFR